MPDTLPVHLNQRELHSLSVPGSFETDDSFVVAVQNHGEAARVHVHLDGDLSDVASIGETNHYVRANDTIEIPVSVHGDGPTHGKLKVVSGYGAVTRWVDVVLTESEEDPVVVDEELSKPQPDPEPTGTAGAPLGSLADRPGLPVLALGAVAVLVAAAAVLLVQDTVVAVGAVVVVAAVAVAAAMVLR